MILTLTPNPSFDRTVALDGELARGQVHRVLSVTSQAGGKGVNISRAAVSAHIPSIAVVPAHKDDAFVLELLGAGIDCRPVRPAGDVRVNLTITEPDGTTTKINSPGATVDASVMKRLSDAVAQHAAAADWVVLAGSLPPGADDEWYADLLVELRGSRARVAVDTSDGPLIALGRRLPEAAPALLKPNAEELAQLTGAAVHNPGEAAAAARLLVGRGVATVLATLGAGGAVLVSAEGAWLARAPETQVLSTVGAGDSSLFGYLLGDLRGEPPEERLRLAVAYGTAAVGLPGTTIPAPAQTHPEQVDIRRLQ